MTNNFFLHTDSLSVQDFEGYKKGISKLIEVKIECDTNDIIFKHKSIYNVPHYLTLCSNPCDEVSNAILQYIEQCTAYEVDISNDTAFAKEIPIYNAGFMGIDFSQCADIREERQVKDKTSFFKCKLHYYKNLIKVSNQNIFDCLLFLFPDYTFEKQAIDDIQYWKVKNKTLIDKIVDLLQDIRLHPFTGGLGKTEVLKEVDKVVSKRITEEHRLTYTYKEKQIIIHRCREHYK